MTLSQQNNLTKVLVRNHCENDEDEGFVDRDSENKLLALLSGHDLAPTYYGRFNNGRVEDFYDGYRALSFHEMAAFGKQIATKMAELHALTLSNEDRNRILGVSQNVAQIWGRVQKWIDLARSKILQKPTDKENLIQLDYLCQQWKWLQNELNDPIAKHRESLEVTEHFPEMECPTEIMIIEFCNEIVLTHMDCQSLNILTPISHPPYPEQSFQPKKANSEEPTIQVIDFEYAGMNARVTDIANTFCEHCDMNNLKPDYKTEFPNIGQQNQFLRAYLLFARPDLANDKKLSNDDWDKILKLMRDQVSRHTLVSHLCWAIWAIAQHYVSSIEFDYLKYAKIRIEGYELFKSKFW